MEAFKQDPPKFVNPTATLRDQFAMATLACFNDGYSAPVIAKAAYELADAMLEARKETQ